MAQGRFFRKSARLTMGRGAIPIQAETNAGLVNYAIEICLVNPNICYTYVNKAKFGKSCANGCPNYARKWSCPPFSPSFRKFAAGWNRLFVLYMRINMNQFAYIKNSYLKIKAANSILKSRADRFLRKMGEQYGRFISAGSCRLCKPCKCKTNVSCAHPDKMTYSFEALGLDVSALVNRCFREPLLWYKPHKLPAYTSVVCGLLTNKRLSIKNLYDEYVKYITSSP
jgi:predicted metal-binding protein